MLASWAYLQAHDPSGLLLSGCRYRKAFLKVSKTRTQTPSRLHQTELIIDQIQIQFSLQKLDTATPVCVYRLQVEAYTNGDILICLYNLLLYSPSIS